MKLPFAAAAMLLGSAALVLAAPTPAPRPLKPLGFAPLAYYNAGCSSCHGPEGTLYEAGMEERLPGEFFRTKMQVMNRDYGDPACDAAALETVIELHRAWDRRRVFVAWTGLEGQLISGEATRAKHVRAVARQKVYPVNFADGNWSFEMPAGMSPREVRIEASDGVSTTTLTLYRETFSRIR